MSEFQTSSSIFLRPEEFAQDAESNLGRANGNTYQRKPGIENVHDGQIMVRLKKKRFIILDYGHVPSDNDHEIAKVVPHICIPAGGGRSTCATKSCQRIGVPVLLYDSDPDEPMSLYLRGGLCFTCQRNLNEKRRTQRKRKATDDACFGGHMPSLGQGHGAAHCNRFRYNDHILDLNPEAVVINGPVDGARARGPGYRCPEIGSDLLRIVSELSHETVSLIHSSGAQSGIVSQNINVTSSAINAMYQKAFLSVSKATFLLTQWKASWDENITVNMVQNTAAEAAALSANVGSRGEAVTSVTSEQAHSAGVVANKVTSLVPSHDQTFPELIYNNTHSMQALMMPGEVQTENSNDNIEGD